MPSTLNVVKGHWGCSSAKKKGELVRLPLFCAQVIFRLPGVAPVQDDVDPIASLPWAPVPTEDRSLGRWVPADEIIGVVPDEVRAHTHLRRDEVPQIPLPHQHRIAVELTAVRRQTPRAAAATPHIILLEVSAKQYRPNLVGRTRQPTLRAPDILV